MGQDCSQASSLGLTSSGPTHSARPAGHPDTTRLISSGVEASMRDPCLMDGEVDVVPVAQLLGHPTRARMLDALLDGRSHRAGELAERAGVAASTASMHLMKLIGGDLVAVEQIGRERRYRLASPAVAEALEALGRIAPVATVRSLTSAQRAEAMRQARTCYDHLAGRLGVGVTDALVKCGALWASDGSFGVPAGSGPTFERIGVDIEAARGTERTFTRACLDWTERRHHLAGALGAEILVAFLRQGWVRRRSDDRALLITPEGREALDVLLGIDVGGVLDRVRR